MRKISQLSLLGLGLIIFLALPSFSQTNSSITFSKLTFEVKICGGGEYISGGDQNTGINSLNEIYGEWEESGNVDIEGKFMPVHLGFNLSGEFIFHITPQIRAGIGISYIAASKKSEVELDWTYWGIDEETLKLRGQAIPFLLNLYYRIPSGKVMAFNLIAGFGLYFGQLRWEYTLEEPGEAYKEEVRWKANSLAFGFHGGLGIEINISPKIALVIEGTGRYAKFGRLTGDLVYEFSSPWGSYSYVESDQTAWLVKLEEGYSVFILDDDKPSDSNVRSVREARFNVSGLCIRAGVKYSF